MYIKTQYIRSNIVLIPSWEIEYELNPKLG